MHPKASPCERIEPLGRRLVLLRKHATLTPVTNVTFTIGGQVKTVAGSEGKSVLHIALDHNIPMEHACGGNGFCTTCLCQDRKSVV